MVVHTEQCNLLELEFQEMSVEERLTLTNMTTEVGAKNGIIEPDQKVLDYLGERGANILIQFMEMMIVNMMKLLNMKHQKWNQLLQNHFLQKMFQ